LFVRRRAPGGGHRIADLEGEVELGGGEGLRAVFEHPFGFRLFGGQLPEQLTAATAMSTTSALLMPKTFSRKGFEVAL
jgi:hypothetical protein